LVTLTLRGRQIKDVLEQQWSDPKLPRILQVSKGFFYTWDGARPYGDHIIADRMALNGQPIDPAASYRVTVNNFLSVGGDGFTNLKQGTAPLVGVYDIDALYGYFMANSPIGPASTDRIQRIN
jgi:5'-nucleotidase